MMAAALVLRAVLVVMVVRMVVVEVAVVPTEGRAGTSLLMKPMGRRNDQGSRGRCGRLMGIQGILQSLEGTRDSFAAGRFRETQSLGDFSVFEIFEEA